MKLSYGRTQEDFKNTFRISLVLLICIFLVLATRIWHLQIYNGEKWFAFSEANRIKLKKIPAIRGRIFDRDQTLIAQSRPAFDLLMVPNKSGDNKNVAIQKIVDLISWDMEEASQAFESEKHPNLNRSFVLKKNLARSEVATIKANLARLAGFSIKTVPTRTYQFPDAASHVLGRMGEIDAKSFETFSEGEKNQYPLGTFWGVSGVEKKYEPALRGKWGMRPVLEDVWGREKELPSTNDLLSVFKEKKAIKGSDIHLTIDLELQILASELLEGKKGALVALDPRSGEILALESKPSFISEYFVRGVDRAYWKSLIENPDKPLYNRAIQSAYPPASTFKAVTAMAGLSEGVIGTEEKVYCPGHYQIGRERKRCWKRRGHGAVDLIQAIAQSCDVYFYEVSKRLGIEKLAMNTRRLGFGQRTGIDFAHEAKGLVPDQAWKTSVYNEKWMGGETLSVGIGQGAMLVTPLQLAVGYAALVNGGVLLKPQILKEMKQPDGKPLTPFQRQEKAKVSLSPSVIEPIRAGLEAVVQKKGGTAFWHANSSLVNIAGKTGTAQVVALSSKKDIKDHAWFIGYAPSDDPEIMVSVIIEHGEHGSSGASPLVKKIIEAYWRGKS